MSRFTTNSIMLNGITADATSNSYDISLRRKLGIETVLASVTGSASVAFSVSNDGTNFVTYNRLTSDSTNTNTQFDTRVSSVTLNSTTPKTYLFFPEGDHFRAIKATYTTITGAIVTSSISNAGTGYTANDVLTIDDGSSGTITVLTVNGSGVVLTYALTTGGTDYTIASHTATGGSGSNFALNVLTVNSGTFTATLQNVD